MSPAGPRRRGRRVALLLSAILIPTTAVTLLVFRVVWQERELSETRAATEQRDALAQLRRELTARLQALRLEVVNRLIGESGRRLSPDSPIVFVAPTAQDRMILPWDDGRVMAPASSAFLRMQREGEGREFQRRDPANAAESYERALGVARSPWERCSARLSLGRGYRKAGMTAEAGRSDGAMLQECATVFDADGVPFALYAAERLLSHVAADRHAREYVFNRASVPQWRSPDEARLLQSLLHGIATPTADEPMRTLAADIRRIDQVSSFAQDLHTHLAKIQRGTRSAPGDLSWMGYGDEPWLVTLVSPTSFAAPVIMAVSSRRIVPTGVALRAAPGFGPGPLGEGFVDLAVEWPTGRFAVSPAVPGLVYGAMLCAVLGGALLAGHLLLRDIHREAETAEMRSHFVASVSHELKTPLTSIRAHAETLLMGRTASADTTADYLKTIVSESERLGRLVDSVLEFSRIEQGRRTYHLEATALDDVVASAARTMEYALAQLGFTLTVSSDGSGPVLLADREALTQVVLNLLGNAMKYSGADKRIELRIGTREGEAFVDVVDHGIGIARDEQTRIFERFHRVQSSETAGIAGAGLGLPLVLHVVEAHRGRIALVSQPGLGSTFSVRLPLQAQA